MAKVEGLNHARALAVLHQVLEVALVEALEECLDGLGKIGLGGAAAHEWAGVGGWVAGWLPWG